MKQSMGNDVEWTEEDEALYNILKSMNPNSMGINFNHDQWLEIKAKREKAFKTEPATDDEQEGELSVLDFVTDDYLKDASCFTGDIGADKGIKISFKEFKDDRDLFSIIVPSSDLPVNDLKELFYDKVVEYAKSDPLWNVSNFHMLHGGNTMEEKLNLWHYMTIDELDNAEVSLVVALKLKGVPKPRSRRKARRRRWRKRRRNTSRSRTRCPRALSLM